MNPIAHSIFNNLAVGETFKLKLDRVNTRFMFHRESQPEITADIRDLGFHIPDKLVNRVIENFPPVFFGLWLSGLISRLHGSQLSITLVETRNQGWESIGEIFDRHNEFKFVVGPAPQMVDLDRYSC